MKRLITAIGLLIVAFYLIFIASPTAFLIAAVITGLLCYREYGLLMVGHDLPHPGWMGALCGIAIVIVPHLPAGAVYLLPLLMLAVIAVFIRTLRLPSLRNILPATGCTLLGAFYCFAPWRFAIELRGQSVHLLFFALALNWAGDTAAFYTGRKLGKHALAPIVSPKKSWEGAAASVAGSALFGLLYLGHFLPRLPWWQVLTMAIAGNVAGQFGDLAESAVKRGAGVKDSGTLLPGHGGVLDRLDSSLFALPVVLLVFLFFSK